MIRGYKYQCPNCGTMTNYKRCPKCGNETDETDPRANPADDCGAAECVNGCASNGLCGRPRVSAAQHGYTIFNHAQGVKPGTRSDL